MKKITLILLFFISSFALNAQVLSHSVDQTLANGLAACAVSESHTTENHFWRSYTPSDFGVTGTYDVGGAAFGMAFTDNGGTNPTLNIVVNFYTSAGAFPTGTLTQIGTKTITMDASQHLTLLNAVLDAHVTVNATDEVVIEIIPDDGTNDTVDIRIAGNNAGENAPSYVSSTACGIPDPQTYASIGFADNHMVLNLLDANAANTTENTLIGFSIYPNPANDILNLNIEEENYSASIYNMLGQELIKVKNAENIDVKQLNTGVYKLLIKTQNYTKTLSFLKK